MSETSERRLFHRILFDATAEIRYLDTIHQVEVLDISLKGALVNFGAEEQSFPEKGQQVSLDIQLDDDTHIAMIGEISHVENGHVGMVSTSIDIDSITHLRRLVELNLGDASELDRELSALYRS
jgi:hypothetical protein